MKLSADHIYYIVKDLFHRSIVIDDFQNELVDHIASCVERKMEGGKKFVDAYHLVLKSFGNTSGLRKIQRQTLRSRNQITVFMIENYFTIAMRN